MRSGEGIDSSEIRDLYDLVHTKDVLSREQERELFRRMRSSNDEERCRLEGEIIKAHMRFAAWEANRCKYSEDFPAVRRAAVRGMLTAVRKYNPDGKTKFVCFACWWMREEMKAEAVRYIGPNSTCFRTLRRRLQRRKKEGATDNTLFTPHDAMLSLDEPIREDGNLSFLDILVSP